MDRRSWIPRLSIWSRHSGPETLSASSPAAHRVKAYWTLLPREPENHRLEETRVETKSKTQGNINIASDLVFGYLLFKYPPFQSVLVFSSSSRHFFLVGNILVHDNAVSFAFQNFDRPKPASASSTAIYARYFRSET